MALMFIGAGFIGLIVTIVALNSHPYRNLSNHYGRAAPESVMVEPTESEA
jgi:hypothetical protein